MKEHSKTRHMFHNRIYFHYKDTEVYPMRKDLVVDLYKLKLNREDVTLRDVLVLEYIVNKKTLRELGKVLHVGAATLSLWLKQENVPARKLTYI